MMGQEIRASIWVGFRDFETAASGVWWLRWRCGGGAEGGKKLHCKFNGGKFLSEMVKFVFVGDGIEEEKFFSSCIIFPFRMFELFF